MIFLVLFTILFVLCSGLVLAFDINPAVLYKSKRIRAGFLEISAIGKKAVGNSAPFRQLQRYRNSRKKDKIKTELLESLSYIRNIAILGTSDKLSVQVLLADLSEQSRYISPVFLSMAHSLNNGDSERAASELKTVLSESYAEDIGRLIVSWEEMDPKELIQTLEVYRNMLKEEALTRTRRRDELISDVVYFPVVLNCMAVLLNFLYVAYYLEQKELLSLFF